MTTFTSICSALLVALSIAFAARIGVPQPKPPAPIVGPIFGDGDEEGGGGTGIIISPNSSCSYPGGRFTADVQIAAADYADAYQYAFATQNYANLLSNGSIVFPVPILGITSPSASVNPRLYGTLDTTRQPPTAMWLLFVNCTTKALTVSADSKNVTLAPGKVGAYIGASYSLKFSDGTPPDGSTPDPKLCTIIELTAIPPVENLFSENVRIIPNYSLVPDYGARAALGNIRAALLNNDSAVPASIKRFIQVKSNRALNNPQYTSHASYKRLFLPLFGDGQNNYEDETDGMACMQIRTRKGVLVLTTPSTTHPSTGNIRGGRRLRVITLVNCSGVTLYFWGLNQLFSLLPGQSGWYMGLSRWLYFSTAVEFTMNYMPLTAENVRAFYDTYHIFAPYDEERKAIINAATIDLTQDPITATFTDLAYPQSVSEANLAANPRYAPYVLSVFEPAIDSVLSLASSSLARKPSPTVNEFTSEYSYATLMVVAPSAHSGSVAGMHVLPQNVVQVTNGAYSDAVPVGGILPIIRITGPTDWPFNAQDPTVQNATAWLLKLDFDRSTVPEVVDTLDPANRWLLFFNCSGTDLKYRVSGADTLSTLSLPRNAFSLFVGPKFSREFATAPAEIRFSEATASTVI